MCRDGSFLRENRTFVITAFNRVITNLNAEGNQPIEAARPDKTNGKQCAMGRRDDGQGANGIGSYKCSLALADRRHDGFCLF